MKTIYKISTLGILLALVFLTSMAAAYPGHLEYICEYCGSLCSNHACIIPYA